MVIQNRELEKEPQNQPKVRKMKIKIKAESNEIQNRDEKKEIEINYASIQLKIYLKKIKYRLTKEDHRPKMESLMLGQATKPELNT